MKITFFKNESYFHPRISYAWTNAEKVDVDFKFRKLRKYSQLLSAVPLVIFLALSESGSDWLFYIITAIICLPVHELCHALFCLLSGRKAERIYFFPYKQVFFFRDGICKTCFWRMEQNTSCSVRFISDYSAVICSCNISCFYFIFENKATVSFDI